MRKKGSYLSLKYGIVGGARQAALSILVTADLLGFSPIQSSPGVTENGL